MQHDDTDRGRQEQGTRSLCPKALIERARDMLSLEAQAVRSLGDSLDSDQLARVVRMLLDCEGHVLITGAGTSRAIADRFAHLLSCSGTPALAVSAADGLHGGAGAVTARDILFVISKGGRSAEVNEFAEIALARGARLIAQTEAPESPLGQMAHAVIRVRTDPRADPYEGMLALGSSLVNAAAGDALCLLLLERRGYAAEQFAQTHPAGAVGHRIACDPRAVATGADRPDGSIGR